MSDVDSNPDEGTYVKIQIQIEEPDPLKVRDIELEVGKLLRWRYDEEISFELLGRDLFITFIFEVVGETPGDEVEALVETSIRSVWKANGEFCPILLQLGPAFEDPTHIREFGDEEYDELMKEGA